MTRHYSTIEFFRQMPNMLLARFFKKFNLLHELDFNKMKETKPEELRAAWFTLTEKDKNKLDAIQQEIFELSCEKGSLAIMDEVRWQMEDEPEKLNEFIETFSHLPNHYHRAMTTYLDYAECWKGATRFYHADTLNSFWRKRKNMGHKQAAVDVAATTQLADMIRTYFHNTEGRGNNCIVEVLKRGNLDYYFAFPEDFSLQAIEWVEGEFGRRPHNPAFEIIFIYSQKDGTLDIHFDGSYKAIEPLQNMFSSSILNLDALPPDPKDNRVYDLNTLRNRNFSFIYKGNSGIQEVTVRKIRFSSRIKRGDRITLEADVSENKFALYDQIEMLSKAMPLRLYNVTQVELVVHIVTDGSLVPKKIPIRLTYPNSCSLKYDDIGLKLRSMLSSSEIEPKEPVEETEELAEA